MISGYVINASLLRHGDVVSFAIDRVARIYPVFLAVHLGIFTVGPLIGYKFFHGLGLIEWAYQFASNVLFLLGVFNLPLAQIVAWSLIYSKRPSKVYI